MNTTVVAALAGLLVGLPSAAVALYVAVQNSRSQRATLELENRKANSADVEHSLSMLREDVDRLREDVQRERTRAETAERRAVDAEHRAADAEHRATEAERRVVDLGKRVEHLERELAAYGTSS